MKISEKTWVSAGILIPLLALVSYITRVEGTGTANAKDISDIRHEFSEEKKDNAKNIEQIRQWVYEIKGDIKALRRGH